MLIKSVRAGFGFNLFDMYFLKNCSFMVKACDPIHSIFEPKSNKLGER